jgi:hypothetical protein
LLFKVRIIAVITSISDEEYSFAVTSGKNGLQFLGYRARFIGKSSDGLMAASYIEDPVFFWIPDNEAIDATTKAATFCGSLASN